MNNGWCDLLEAALGIAVGASCTAMVVLSPLPSAPPRIVAVPQRICPPSEAAPGPWLDGDVLVRPGVPPLICNGYAGRWESPAARRHRLSERRSLNKGWRGA